MGKYTHTYANLLINAQGKLGYDYFVDLDGEHIKRTPWSHPYSFDEHVIWKSDDCQKTDCFVYSDRMMSWDWNKFHESMKVVWPNGHGHYFDSDDPADVETFMSLYQGHPVKLTAILKGCNVSNGYPYFVFGYQTIK